MTRMIGISPPVGFTRFFVFQGDYMIKRFSQIEVESDNEAIMFSQNDIYSDSGFVNISMPLEQFAIIARDFLGELEQKKAIK